MRKISLPKTAWAYIALAVVVFTWSFTPILSNMKVVKDNYSPGMIIALRSLFATLTLLVINIKNLKKIGKEYFKVAVPSGIILALAMLSQMVGYRYGVDPGAAAVLENLALIVIPIVLYICVKEKPTWTKILAAVHCFIGSAFIALAGSEGNLFSVSLGKWLACIAGILYGINFVITGVYAKKLNSSAFILIQVAIQMVVAFVYSLVFERIFLASENVFAYSLAWKPLLVMVVLGVFATGICWTLRAYCLKWIPVMVVSIIMPLSTVLTGVWSVIGGMESATWELQVGTVIVIVAILIAETGDKRKKKYSKEELAEPLIGQESALTDEEE
jgi:drug/metabolite transporter (DMT)-like permease